MGLINFTKIPKGNISQSGSKLRMWMYKMGISTNEQLASMKESTLLEYKNFGKDMLAILKGYLKSEGYSLTPEKSKPIKKFKTFEAWFKHTLPTTYTECYKIYEQYKKDTP
ncbi:MAG: hypothetical protein Q8K02_18850 [Flavobacterium sp.]|nr:hypothetical protein [Flavobacterium sp.]